MKRLSGYITALALTGLMIPSQMSAQQPRYKLIDMGTLGGPQSFVNDGNSDNNAVDIVNDRGTMVGWADTSTRDPLCFNEDCFVSHAFQWRDGARTDLEALDKALSSQAVWVSANGLIAGTSENGEIDPSLSGFPELRAVLWRQGRIASLGTLPGGFESSANVVNSKGQVIGWATNSTPDADSMQAPGFLPTQTRAFLWQEGAMKDLGTLGTGTDAMAQFINERGEVVGWSYTGEPQDISVCTLPIGNPPATLAIHSFIWDERNKMRDLGTLGGTCAIATGINNDGVVIGDNVNDVPLERAFIWKDGEIKDLGGSIGGQQTGAEAINDSGQVAGFATLEGEALSHAVLWRRIGEVTDLGALGADECSFATSINSKTEVVGGSEIGCVFDQSHAVLWEQGTIFDLNNLIAPGSSLTLQVAQGINERGEIAGTGVDINNNEHAFLLVPCDATDASDCQEVISGETASILTQRPSMANPDNSVRQMLHRRPGPMPHILTLGRAANGTGSAPAIEAGSSLPLTITSIHPPNGTSGVGYGPIGTIYLSCSWSPVLGWHEVCFQCDPTLIGPGSCPPFIPNFTIKPHLVKEQGHVGFTFKATGGAAPYYWTLTSWPPGLGLVNVDIVNGTPTRAGTYYVTATVRDSEPTPRHAVAHYTIHIYQ